ncbi:MAG: caspase family protein [Campylobacterota bacterium]|nr:caspase family protein [Campylobacterota bacterium]
MLKKVFIPLVLILLFIQGCTSKAVLHLENNPIQSQQSLDNIANAIESSAIKRGWKTQRVAPGNIVAQIDKRQHMAKVNILYDTRSYSIKYADSKNLKYTGSSIHRAYNSWVTYLKRDIDAMLNNGMSGTVAQIPSPAITPTPVAPIAVHSAAGMTSLDAMLDAKHAQPDNKKYAVIIGINHYDQQADVPYADNSAQSFKKMAVNALGVPDSHIMMLVNSQATSGRIKAKIALAKELVEKGGTIYFYFAGHGVPARDGETYILPADMSADTIHLEPQLKLDVIYKTLSQSDAKRVYAFIDSCFSGRDDSGELIYRGVAPVFKKKKKQFSAKKLSVMTAGKSSEFANQHAAEQQRLFSYYLISGLADEKHKNIKSLYEYVRKNVKRESLNIGLGYKQVPQLH